MPIGLPFSESPLMWLSEIHLPYVKIGTTYKYEYLTITSSWSPPQSQVFIHVSRELLLTSFRAVQFLRDGCLRIGILPMRPIEVIHMADIDSCRGLLATFRVLVAPLHEQSIIITRHRDGISATKSSIDALLAPVRSRTIKLRLVVCTSMMNPPSKERYNNKYAAKFYLPLSFRLCS